MPTNVDDTQIEDAPEFWTVKPDRMTKLKWQQAMDDYLVAFDKEPEQVEFSIDVVKDCLRFLKKHDGRWKGFSAQDLNTYAYPAHMVFY